LIEAALEESVVERWWRETGGPDAPDDKTGVRCDWLHIAIISDAMGRIVPCCNADYKNHGRLVLADVATAAGNIMNSADYRAARRVLSDPDAGKTDVICAKCLARPEPQIGLGAVAAYTRWVPALAFGDMAFLYDWSRHSPLASRVP
jgi:hypothetical protein